MPRKVRGLLLPLAALAVAACDAPTFPAEDGGAYDFTFETDPPSVMRWPAGTTIRIYVAGGQDATRAVVLRDAFLEAAAKWESAVLFGEYRFAEAASLAEADVVLFWWGDSPPVDLEDCPPERIADGLTWSCPDLAQRRLIPFPVNGQPSRVRMAMYILGSHAAQPENVKRLVLHELGHVLGIGRHAPGAADVMAPHAPVDELSPADRATVQVLYHVAPDILP